MEREQDKQVNWGSSDTSFPIISSRKPEFREQVMTWMEPNSDFSFSQWSEVQQILNGTPLYMYQDCPLQDGGDTDHWLRSNWIYRGEEASRVHVELQFTVRDCKSFPGGARPLGCKETFNLLYMESDQDVGIQLRRPLFQKVLLPRPTSHPCHFGPNTGSCPRSAQEKGQWQKKKKEDLGVQ